MELKKRTTYDGRLKDLHFEWNLLIDENWEVIDIAKYLKAAYGDRNFNLSTTAKEEEILDIEVEEDEE